MPGFTELERLMNPQAAAPMNPMEQPNQMAQQQAASELELQTLLQQIRERFESQREAQLAQTSEQFDPILDRMRGNLESAAAPVPQGSRLGDLGEIIANAFYTSKFKERLKTPYERRQSEAGIRQQQEMNALAQLRLMMEGKSKAEDRITKSFDDRTKAEIEAASKSLKAQQDQKKWEAGMELRGQAEGRLQGMAALAADRERRQREQFALTKEGQAAQWLKQNAPGIDPNSDLGNRLINQRVRLATEQRQAGKDGSFVLKAGSTGEPEVVFVPSARGRLPENPLATGQYNPTPSQKLQAIPAPAPPAPGGTTSPSTATWTKSTQVPVKPVSEGKRYSWYKGVFDNAPTVSRRDKIFMSGIQGNKAYEKLTFNKERAGDGRGSLDSLARIVEGGHLKFLSAWDFSKFFDLAAGSFFDPTAGAAKADQLRNLMKEASSENPEATAFDVRKWENLPDSVLELYMKLGSSLNQYIKTMTGVAASSKEFGRLTMVAPTRIDSPNTLAFKLTYNTMAAAINQAEVGGFQSGGKDLYKIFKDSGTPFERFVSDLATSFKDGLLSGTVGRNDISTFLNEPTFLQAAVLYDKAYQAGGPEEASKITDKLAERFTKPKDVMRRLEETKRKNRSIFDEGDD